MDETVSKSVNSRAWSRPELKVVGTLKDVGAIVRQPGFDTKNNHGS